MLQRYKMYRGPRPADDPMPDGLRQDTRKHTTHCLRPPAALVKTFFADPDAPDAWTTFAVAYRAALDARFAADRGPFDDLAATARAGDVHLGCSCPTKKNPDVSQCHTVLALQFMKEKYPDLEVRLPRR